jgi:hypothetical protein
MKTQRRWLNSVITAAAREDVSLPWAARSIDKRSDMIATNVASQSQAKAAVSTPHYAIAAR